MRKGFCLTPKRLFRLMMQNPFLLCLCLRGAFTGFWWFFFSLFLWAGSGKPCMTARFINETSRHPRQANRGRMILFVRPDRSGQTDNIILPCCRFARFHASGIVPFSFCRFLFLRISLLKFSVQSASTSVYLRFCAFQWFASGSHFRAGCKGNSGIWRESKVKPPVLCGNLHTCAGFG